MKKWFAAMAVVFVGCASPSQGLWRLWESEWTMSGAGREWVRGVDCNDECVFEVERRATCFRSRVLNIGVTDEDLHLTGPGMSQYWRIPGGQTIDVETAHLGRGRYKIEGNKSLFLGEPRLVGVDSDAKLLVFVVVDTLRAEAVNAETTPAILQALQGARNFEDTTANSSWTLPSMASMFTSLPVLELTTPQGDLVGIPEGVETWAETFRNAGFSGGGIVANYTVHVQNGFARGFDTYLVPEILDEENRSPDGSWVVDEAQRWLDAHKGENAFLFMHLMDPHEPYRNHQQGSPAPDLYGLAHRMREATDEETRRLQELYEGEVRHVDHALGPFLETLPDDAVIVFTADHGEALGEHGCWAHGYTLYEPVVRVPLLIKAPGLEGGVESNQTQLLDLAPTVLDLFAIAPAPAPAMKGVSLLQGGSQTATISATFSPGSLRWMWRKGSTKVVFRTADQPLVVGGFRKTLEEADPLAEGVFCYNLKSDPGELDPGPVSEEIRSSVARDFALSAGRLVPGMQVFSVGTNAGSEVVLNAEGGLEFHQIWSAGQVTVSESASMVKIETATNEICSLFAIGEGAVPIEVGTGRAIPPWEHLDPSNVDPAQELQLEINFDVPGTYFWWNPSRDLVVGGHDETMSKLRALGYIQ